MNDERLKGMAELAISIAGIPLAWKGILDFGKLILTLMDDDIRRRDVLAIRLETCQHALKAWGELWGINCPEGKFHSFEPSRKQLISRIVYYLRDSRDRATVRLKERYGCHANSQDITMSESAGKAQSRISSKLKGTSKRMKEKALWVMVDQSSISILVAETFELLKCLKYLCSMSKAMLDKDTAIFRSDFLGASSSTILGNLPQGPQVDQAIAGDISNLMVQQPGPDADGQTLAAYATMPIRSSRMAAAVQEDIERALYFHGDVRVPEAIGIWWRDSSSGILALETPDSATDRTANSACVLTYYLATCQKIIHVFEPGCTSRSLEQFSDMLRNLMETMLSMRVNRPLENVSEPLAIHDSSKEPATTATVHEWILACHGLLQNLLNCCDEKILLVIEGASLVEFNDGGDVSILLQSFISGLQEMCNKVNPNTPAGLKILLGFKGHVPAIYKCMDERYVCDFTDFACRKTNMRQQLALWV